MLASPVEDIYTLPYPLLASPKIDGVRALIVEGEVRSRSLKLIPNLYVQSLFGHLSLEGLDGELVVGSPTAHDCMQSTTSGVMTIKGEPDVHFYVFDRWDRGDDPFVDDLKWATAYPFIIVVPQVLVSTPDELLQFQASILEVGYEGVMLRKPGSPYKFGRSTLREGYLLKLKTFSDGEAEVIGFEERMHNGNEATTDELGRTKRSSHKANKTGRGDLGALLLRNSEGVEFSCGTGFTDLQRSEIWANQDNYLGQLAKYKHFEIGSKDSPRFPVFIGFRSKLDMDD